MKKLSELQVGQSAIISKIHSSGNIKKRIMEMGVTKGTQVKLTATAPFGDPLIFCVRGYSLSMRKDDAACIDVE